MTLELSVAIFCAFCCWTVIGLGAISRRRYKKFIKEQQELIRELVKEIEALQREARVQHRIIMTQEEELKKRK